MPLAPALALDRQLVRTTSRSTGIPLANDAPDGEPVTLPYTMRAGAASAQTTACVELNTPTRAALNKVCHPVPTAYILIRDADAGCKHGPAAERSPADLLVRAPELEHSNSAIANAVQTQPCQNTLGRDHGRSGTHLCAQLPAISD